jgi:MFS family permease
MPTGIANPAHGSAARPAAKGAFVVHCMVSASNSALDVLLKNGVIVFAAYHGGLDTRTLSLIAALSWALFMAPFFLLSAHAGFLGDRFDNRRLALALKAADLAIAAGAAYGFRTGNLALLLGVVFAKGCTATLFSPIKFSLVAALLPAARQGAGYALLEAVSMMAILGGTYLGAMLGAEPDPWKIGLVALVIAGASLLTAVFYPRLARSGDEITPLGIDPIRPTAKILHMAYSNRHAFSAILALSWFWALGAVYLANVAPLVRDTFHGDKSQVAAILVIFTLGVSLGLGSSAWLNRGRLARRMGLLMAAVMAVLGLGLLGSSAQAFGRTLVLFLGIAFASGVYAGHYSAILYEAAGDRGKARLFAANNIMSSLVMVLCLGMSALVLGMNLPVETCLALFAAASIPVTVFIGAMNRPHRGAENA